MKKTSLWFVLVMVTAVLSAFTAYADGGKTVKDGYERGEYTDIEIDGIVYHVPVYWTEYETGDKSAYIYYDKECYGPNDRHDCSLTFMVNISGSYDDRNEHTETLIEGMGLPYALRKTSMDISVAGLPAHLCHFEIQPIEYRFEGYLVTVYHEDSGLMDMVLLIEKNDCEYAYFEDFMDMLADAVPAGEIDAAG